MFKEITEKDLIMIDGGKGFWKSVKEFGRGFMDGFMDNIMSF